MSYLSFALFPRMVKQRKSMNKQSDSVRHTPRKNLSSSSIFSQSSFNSHASDTSMVSTVLDESLIREQTEVDHFWGRQWLLLLVSNCENCLCFGVYKCMFTSSLFSPPILPSCPQMCACTYTFAVDVCLLRCLLEIHSPVCELDLLV